METKVCGGTGYAVEDFRLSLDRGDMGIGVLVRCYIECSSPHMNSRCLGNSLTNI